MGFYQAQKIEKLEARIAELEAKICQCGLWEDMGPRQAEAISFLHAQKRDLEKQMVEYENKIRDNGELMTAYMVGYEKGKEDARKALGAS